MEIALGELRCCWLLPPPLLRLLLLLWLVLWLWRSGCRAALSLGTPKRFLQRRVGECHPGMICRRISADVSIDSADLSRNRLSDAD